MVPSVLELKGVNNGEISRAQREQLSPDRRMSAYVCGWSKAQSFAACAQKRKDQDLAPIP